MKRIKYIALILLLVSSVSCNKWLDVADSNVITEDELYKKEKGYKQNLTGVYNLMGQQEAYGVELSIGLPDIIAQYWSNADNSEFADIMRGVYTGSLTEARIKNIWAKLYEAIGNANIVLGKLGDTNTEGLQHYDIIKGEALGLRAYLHLDLLRLFGPVIKNDSKALSIPYRTKFDNIAVKRMPASQVLDLIEKDLLAAKELLNADPIKVNGRYVQLREDKNDLTSYFRSIRMNYYAVVGTLARVYQLKGEKGLALQYAQEVIDAKLPSGTKIFELIKRNDVVVSDKTKIDRMFSREIIFAVYDKNLKQKLGANCGFGQESSNSTGRMHIVNEDMKKHIYINSANGSAEDYRMINWWGVYISFPVYQKHYRDNDNKAAYEPMLALIRLSEMYYIAAESQIGVDNTKALALLNEVRVSRKLSVLTADKVAGDNALAEQIFDESRKEFWGEGQLFYSYKRLFKDIKTNESAISASNSLFVLPLPKDEHEYANN